ncbi:retrovirus-related Pol polyprotein from transposon 17.6 [Trichonephila clavipes]|nr:retrovirus-related Pol polyprotein from transposon 17.6 [Trichonephila clavipes]
MFKLDTVSQVNVIPKSELLKWDEKPVGEESCRCPESPPAVTNWKGRVRPSGCVRTRHPFRWGKETHSPNSICCKQQQGRCKNYSCNLRDRRPPIIRKVEEPTEWVSNMVVINSPKKLRICLDPRSLQYEAIQRPHYPIPIADALITKLQGGKVFTILDAKNGFWQLPLDEESSYLTTFCTTWGRYRFLVLPQVAYGSVLLTRTQQRYAQVEKELMAVIYGLEHFNYYTYGRIVTVQTDHKPILGLSRKPYDTISPRLQRMLLRLNKYNIQLEYVPGKNLVVVDALSRAQSTTDNFDEVLGQEATVRINLLTQASPTGRKLQV